MMRTLAFVICVLFAVPLQAAEPVKFDRRLCQALVKHTPDANVAYQPGVDVNGKPVAPADLSDSNPTIHLPQQFNIPLTTSLQKYLNLSGGSLLNTDQSANIPLGTLTVEGDRVSYNGQPLTSAQQDNLAVLCMQPNRHQNNAQPVSIVPATLQ